MEKINAKTLAKREGISASVGREFWVYICAFKHIYSNYFCT